MVERNLAKVEVASSSLVSRSNFRKPKREANASLFCKNAQLSRQYLRFRGAVAKRLCTGLQIRVGRFDSGPRLHRICAHPRTRFCVLARIHCATCPGGEIGRRIGLKIRRLAEWQRTGSSPVRGTTRMTRCRGGMRVGMVAARHTSRDDCGGVTAVFRRPWKCSRQNTKTEAMLRRLRVVGPRRPWFEGAWCLWPLRPAATALRY